MKKSKNAVFAEKLSVTSPQVFIFVALSCEAKPLIKAYGLTKENFNHPFLIYKGGNLTLTVTGIGKIAMAGALTYTLALFNQQRPPVLVNIGIAGHKTQSMGYLYQAMKIIDADTGKVHYPSLLIKNASETSVLCTVSKPHNQYKAEQLYDMEGSAFYEMAVRFSSSELIQCIKVVSDNEQSSIENINAKTVYQWIDEQIKSIDKIIKDLESLSKELLSIEPEGYSELIEEWHFTVSEQIKLKALMMRWRVLTQGTVFEVDKEKTKNGKEILKKLDTELNRLAFFL